MTKSQNKKNEQQKDLCITSEKLTEMMKKGDLPHDIYYVICSKNDTVEIVRNWVQTTSCLKPTISYEFPSNLEVKQVLAPVPTFEEWEQLQNWANFTNDYHELREKLEIAEYKNAQLKEVLKECQHILKEQIFYRNTPVETDTAYRTRCLKKQELLTKIDEVLK